MKKAILLISIFVSIQLFGVEIDTLKISSKITNVTVFFDGAQITRNIKLNLKPGKHLIVLDKLPQELNPNSIQVLNNGNGELQSVKHQLDYPKDDNAIIIKYDAIVKGKKVEIERRKNEKEVLDIEEDILLKNSKLNNENSNVNIETIKEASLFYNKRLNEIRQNKLDLKLEIDSITKLIKSLYKDLNKKIASENITYSKVSFIVESKTGINSNYQIKYFVKSAGWTPEYEFRVNSLDKPAKLVYTASIFQTTGEKWDKVNLVLSTNMPSVNNNKPELKTWFIEKRRVYKKNEEFLNGTVKGKVIDEETGEPIPFANIIFNQNGKQIQGVVTDFNGLYTIRSISPGYYDVEVSFVGYVTTEKKGVSVKSDKINFIDFKMKSSVEMLEEIEIVDYRAPRVKKQKRLQNTVRGARSSGQDLYVDGVKMSPEVEVYEGFNTTSNVISLEYNIDVPYTIPSDGLNYKVRIKSLGLPVDYQYYAIPKLDNDVYLTANLNDWSDIDLLSGKASVYYKGTFTGETEINTDDLNDTLKVSLSRDRNIIVKRSMQKEKYEKKFLGNKVKEFVSWNISLKNNNKTASEIIVYDQFPVSENSNIIIEQLESTGGKIDKRTGKVEWKLKLAPGEKKELQLEYSVKYPAYMNLKVE